MESHLLKLTNTKRFSHHFKKVALIHEKDHLKRKVAETYLMNTLDTPINKNGRYPKGLTKGVSVNVIPSFKQCEGLTNEEKRCQKYGHSNGFCHYHGGNGESMASLQTKHEKAFNKKLEEMEK